MPGTKALEESADDDIVSGNNERYLDFHAQCPIFFPIFSKFGFFRQILIKTPNKKFHGNPPKVATLMHVDRWTDMTKIIVSLRDYTNAPKNVSDYSVTHKTFETKNFRMQVYKRSPLHPVRSSLEYDTVF